MQLQQQPERWLCMATAFAMAVDLPVEEFLQYVGHRGEEIVWPTLDEPACRAGVHAQECIEVCLGLDYSVTPIQLVPRTSPTPHGTRQLLSEKLIHFPDGNWNRWYKHLQDARGVMECNGPKVSHAIAYDRGMIYDPTGSTYAYSREACERRGLFTHCFWKIDKLK
jgi:hypothetical protein